MSRIVAANSFFFFFNSWFSTFWSERWCTTKVWNGFAIVTWLLSSSRIYGTTLLVYSYSVIEKMKINKTMRYSETVSGTADIHSLILFFARYCCPNFQEIIVARGAFVRAISYWSGPHRTSLYPAAQEGENNDDERGGARESTTTVTAAEKKITIFSLFFPRRQWNIYIYIELTRVFFYYTLLLLVPSAAKSRYSGPRALVLIHFLTRFKQNRYPVEPKDQRVHATIQNK